MSSAVEKLVKTCHSCQVTAQPQVKYEPLKMTEILKSPWEVLIIDLKGPFPTGKHLLVLIDYRSCYPVIAKLKEISSTTIINALTNIFAIFSFPKMITANNRKQFQSHEFPNYNSQHGIQVRYVTPYWPSANGEVEHFNRTTGKAIQSYHAEGKD